MTCTTHDRVRCSHCAVLARCEALVPEIEGNSHMVEALKRWAAATKRWNRGRYPLPWLAGITTSANRNDREAIANQIAARLVAWIRWVGSCPVHPHHAPIQLVDSTLWLCSWESASHICTYFARDATPDHPLDPLGMTWAQRVAMSSEECPQCNECHVAGHRQYGPPIRLLDGLPAMPGECSVMKVTEPCSHDGIAWDFVSIIADQLDRDKPVGWYAVHAWREPSPWDGMNWGVDRRPEMLESMRFTLSALRDE